MNFMLSLLCIMKGHDWHYHGAIYRYCRRCGIEQVFNVATETWRRHEG
jgi:hypothetical protein